MLEGDTPPSITPESNSAEGDKSDELSIEALGRRIDAHLAKRAELQNIVESFEQRLATLGDGPDFVRKPLADSITALKGVIRQMTLWVDCGDGPDSADDWVNGDPVRVREAYISYASDIALLMD